MIFVVFYRKMMIWGCFASCSLVFLLLACGVSSAEDRSQYSLSRCDPVSYQIANAPEKGREDLSLSWGGRIWAFTNEGNREAFKRDPKIYAPLFQGCDALSLAQGYRAEGLAKIYLVYNQRLLVFQSREHRALFLTEPDTILAKAQSRARDVKCGPYQ
ncbi:hypothetical protein [Pseudovibrio sp. Tun.PSC04-5.I4]|uniref:hypothetical protein n=1 Tax=Pseudovibrio sp. Tun.PSC04-5.I4 TaxID=1798213 RepID=UPI000B89FDFC|nr:hypothetical protein [Pseudovibrio sp. Tun.PSC04-5.I4]